MPTRKLPDWLVRIVGSFDSKVRGQLFELGKVRRLSSAKCGKGAWMVISIEETIIDTATSLEAGGTLS